MATVTVKDTRPGRDSSARVFTVQEQSTVAKFASDNATTYRIGDAPFVVGDKDGKALKTDTVLEDGATLVITAG